MGEALDAVVVANALWGRHQDPVAAAAGGEGLEPFVGECVGHAAFTLGRWRQGPGQAREGEHPGGTISDRSLF